MLVRADVCVVTAYRAGRADSANQVLAFQKLKSAIDRGLRQPRQLLAQPLVDRFGGGMREVLGERSINRQALRGNSNAARTAEFFELSATMIDSATLASHSSCAGNSHVRIIIIYGSLVKPGFQKAF